MSWFTSSTGPSGNKPTPAASSPPTANTPRMGPGAEQERYASHFSIGTEGLDQIKQAGIRALNFKGEGAEQDRYAKHFSGDNDVVRKAAQSILRAKAAGAEQDRWENHFGLGYDGWQRARTLALARGSGAEQVRCF